MPIVLLRVDERLIHGQVVVGWGTPLHADRLVVVDDEIAGSAWEQELYCLGVPPEMEARFVDVGAARAALPTWRADATHRFVVLVRDVSTLSRLCAGGAVAGEAVNLGGIHHAPGRTQRLPYLYLNEDEEDALRDIQRGGVQVAARDLPSSRAVPLHELLAEM